MPRGCRGEGHADVKQVVGDLLDEDWRDWFDELVACDDGTLLLGYVWLLWVDLVQLGGTRGAGVTALILIPVGASSWVSKCGVAEGVEHPKRRTINIKELGLLIADAELTASQLSSHLHLLLLPPCTKVALLLLELLLLFQIVLLLVHLRYIWVLNPLSQVLDPRLKERIENGICACYWNLQKVLVLWNHRYWLRREKFGVEGIAACAWGMHNVLEEAIVLAS